MGKENTTLTDWYPKRLKLCHFQVIGQNGDQCVNKPCKADSVNSCFKKNMKVKESICSEKRN